MLPVQLSLDAYAAERAKLDALERVDAHADTEWKITALEVVKSCAAQMPEFTTDDVWQALAKIAIGTHENRAIGPVMNAAARAGYITPTDRFQNCNRVSRHRAPVRVWKSNLFMPKA